MNMQSLLDKFDAVEITNESRISGVELDYCEKHQALYEKVLEQHKKAFDTLRALKNDCETFLESVSDVNEYTCGSYTYKQYDCDYVDLTKEGFATKQIAKIHDKYISIIIDYFKSKYSVKIDVPTYEDLLSLKEPERVDCYSYRYSSLSDEEKESLREKQRTYESELDAYHDTIISSTLDYNTILDHIFVTLNGKTFAEQAEQEIKRDSRSACKTYWGNPNTELKNKKIVMDILSPRKGWRDEYEVELSGASYLAVLRALTYFNSNKSQKEIYSSWVFNFTGYTKKESEGFFARHSASGSKVQSFKYYKNGKFEITFDSHVSAKAFASEYLDIAGVISND